MMKTSPRTTKDRATTANVRSDTGAPGITVGFHLSRYRRNIYKYVTSHDILGPNEEIFKNEIFAYSYTLYVQN